MTEWTSTKLMPFGVKRSIARRHQRCGSPCLTGTRLEWAYPHSCSGNKSLRLSRMPWSRAEREASAGPRGPRCSSAIWHMFAVAGAFHDALVSQNMQRYSLLLGFHPRHLLPREFNESVTWSLFRKHNLYVQNGCFQGPVVGQGCA